MSAFIQNTLHQIDVTVKSIDQLFHMIDPQDWPSVPFQNKFTLGELASHISLILKADLMIANGASQKEMNHFYDNANTRTVRECQVQLTDGQQRLIQFYTGQAEEELFKKTTSYWGTTYTRFEWLLEILVHLTHHREQLFLYLNLIGKDCSAVSLFE
ncbi:DinB family protein [Falsibacillus albus]|uniref:DinB family protein n=1 Tax=Falsibacillus albus TaxID=2478915 RepID=A0A3L7K3W0_9BACI|nr:DinB family protein [Falsibacillus albus]RLQ95402.1 DinB family protein [Falsibacillus albus]